MQSNNNHEEIVLQNERKLNELQQNLEKSRQEYQSLLEELQLSPEQLAHFVNNQDNFSAQEWKAIQEEHQKLDVKLNLELNEIRNPQKAKQVQQEQSQIRPHWLFVR